MILAAEISLLNEWLTLKCVLKTIEAIAKCRLTKDTNRLLPCDLHCDRVADSRIYIT